MLGQLKYHLTNYFRAPLPTEIVESDYPTLNSVLDFHLSPYTGWTRQHWEELATLILTGVSKFFSSSRTGVHIPGHNTSHGRHVDGLEGYARTLTIAAPWFNRQRSKILRQKISINLLNHYQLGLRNGTNPTHKDYWGDFLDYDQRILEAADIAWSIYIARHYLWEPLSTTEKESVADWLRKVIGKKVKLNNWILSKIMINLVLRALGYPYSEQEIQHGFKIVESLYVGEGWYQDGLTESFDYYGAWMFHDYLLKFMLIEGALTSSEKIRYLDRSEKFLSDYQHFFAADGSHVCFGRSQIYRAAALGPIVMSALVGGKALSPGLSRRLASGNLKFFLTRGMISKKGNLTLGFTRTFLPMIESYSCGGSPYLIGRAFSALLLSAEHPFWMVTEEPLPIEQRDYSIAIPVAGLLLDGEKQGGQVQLINHKSSNVIEGRQKKYGNFAYSSHFGYEATFRQGRYNFDSSILISEDGKTFVGRQKPFNLQSFPGFGASFFLPFNNEETIIYSNTILCDHFQIRVHQIISNRPFEIIEGGYALGYEEGTPRVLSGPDWEFVGNDSHGSFIRRLVGYDYTIPAESFGNSKGGNNILYPYSLTPGVGLSFNHHRYILLATLARGSVNGERPQNMVDFIKMVQNGLNWIMVTLWNEEVIFTQIGTISDRIVQANGIALSGRTTFARISAKGKIIAHYQI